MGRTVDMDAKAPHRIAAATPENISFPSTEKPTNSLQLKEKTLEGLIELILDPGSIPHIVRGSILLLDSNPNSSSGMAFRLDKLAHTPFTVKTSAEAFEALKHSTIDLIIVDENNLDLLSDKILSFCSHDDHYIPFIVIGSNDSSMLIEKAFQLGADDYLTRPINNSLLKVRINSSLQKKAMHNQRLDKLREARTAMESLHTEMGYFEDGFLLLNSDFTVINNNASLFSIYPHLSVIKTPNDTPLDLTGLSFEQIWNSHIENSFYDPQIVAPDNNFMKKIHELLKEDSGTWTEKTKTGEILIIHFQRTFDKNILLTIQATGYSRVNPHQLAYLAYYDALTRTVNRQFFLHHLDHLVTQPGTGPFAMMLIDLDGFKLINDTYGHAHGDWILKQVAERVKGTLRQGDIVSRIGGDEFTLLIKNMDDPKIIEQLATRMLNVICTPYKKGDAIMEIGASIGVVQYPKDASSTEELLKKADDAMYSIKQKGKRGYAFALPGSS